MDPGQLHFQTLGIVYAPVQCNVPEDMIQELHCENCKSHKTQFPVLYCLMQKGNLYVVLPRISENLNIPGKPFVL
jgi:hypothetical protein